ncbi:MAG: hypothetical protein QOE35_3007 [Actinomycetota bacterium]
MSLDLARKVADAVLYEGYVLYPYRASAQKNQLRWQWGVLVPREQSEAAAEPWAAEVDLLVDAGAAARVRVQARCLQLETRAGEPPWDEGVEREVTVDVVLDGSGREDAFTFPAGDDGGRVRQAVAGRVTVATEALPGPYGVVKLGLRIENLTPWAEREATRDEVVRHSLVGTHLLVSVDGGRFLSLVDPPEWARPYAEGCRRTGLWPVLVGDDDDVMLATPIILEEHPQIAPESPGDLYDALEIDEILSLRTLTLTDEEKAEARATDPRAAAVIDRVDAMPGEILERLHGAIRTLRPPGGDDVPTFTEPDAPWWDPGADASVSPETDTVDVAGVPVGKGTKVKLVPRVGADAQDMFLDGRIATVEAVLADVDGGYHLAVTLDDDPGSDIQRVQGRFFYFRPDEVMPS